MNKTMTLSFKTNPSQTNIRHNNRELTEKEFRSDAHKHIQREKSKYNIQIFKRDIKDVYHELFDDALNAYNAKQNAKIARSMIIINTSRSPKTWTYKGNSLLQSVIRQIGKD